MIATLIISFISAILMNNVILMQTLGICPFLGVSKKVSSAVGMGAAVTFVLVIATALTWPIYHLILAKLDIAYMDTIVFILVIASIVQLVEMVIKKTSKGLYKALGVYLPLITTNCCVLGVAQGNISNGYNYGQSLLIALATGLGFLLVMFLFSTIRGRLDSGNATKSFKGAPLALITAGLLALAFLGFSGMFSVFSA